MSSSSDTLVSTLIVKILDELVIINYNKTDYELYVYYINQYEDSMSLKIINSNNYMTNLIEDLDQIEGQILQDTSIVSKINRVLIQTVIDIGGKCMYYYMFKNIDYNTLILFIESFLITQEIMDILHSHSTEISLRVVFFIYSIRYLHNV